MKKIGTTRTERKKISSHHRSRSTAETGSRPQIKQLHQLAQDLIRTQEEQRRVISRELHDNIAQVLSATAARLALTKKKSNKPAVVHDLDKLRRDLVAALEEVRKFARDLRPAMLDSFCLCRALENHISSLRERTAIDFAYDSNVIDHDLLDAEQRTHIFRIAQEAMHNIEKHSHASQAWVRLWHDKTTMNLEVGDNGRSFHPDRAEEARKDGHLGLLTMRERAQMLGGELHIHAHPGAGTTIQAAVPLNVHQGDTPP